MASGTSDAANNAAGGEEPSRELLEELCARFILTAPKTTLMSKERMFFLVEQTWWFYEDKVRVQMPHLKHYASYATFAEPLFRKCDALAPMRPNLSAYMEEYRRYKQSIPVYGAILLDAAMEQVLLVRGNKSSMGWGFPRGKVNEGEAEAECAIREVFEETGYDIRDSLRPTEYLEATSDGKRQRLYIVTGLDPTTQEFTPHCKWEIGAYAWHRVDALPATAEEASQVYMSHDGVRHRFFMIHPFVGRLRKWIDKQRRGGGGRQGQPGSVANSAPSSMHVTQAQLAAMLATAPQQQQQQQGQAGGTVTPGAAAAAAGGRGGRDKAQGGGRGGGGAKPPLPPLPPQGPAAQQLQQQALAATVQEKLGQLQLLQQAQVQVQVPVPVQDSAAAAATEWVPSMSSFRFDTTAILRCFAAPA